MRSPSNCCVTVITFPQTLQEWADFDYVGAAGPWVDRAKFDPCRAVQILPKACVRSDAAFQPLAAPRRLTLACGKGMVSLPHSRKPWLNGCVRRKPSRNAMDVLLAHGYYLREDPHELQVMKPYPPLGILYIAAYLKSRGFSVSVFDATFRRTGRLYRPPGN